MFYSSSLQIALKLESESWQVCPHLDVAAGEFTVFRILEKGQASKMVSVVHVESIFIFAS